MAAGAALEHDAHAERDDVNPDVALLNPGGRIPQQSDPSKGAPKDTPPGASRAKLPPLAQTNSPPRFELPSSVLETHDWQSARDGVSSIDIDQIWADAACALDECARADGSPPGQRDAANTFLDDHEGRTPPTALIGYLPCGDVHICRPGIVCEYCQPNKDQLMVCTVTGMIQCPESKDEFFDLNGGDSKRSGDPDLNCGDFVVGKKSCRWDPLLASRLAYEHAEERTTLEEAADCDAKHQPEEAVIQWDQAQAARPLKRGALCVGEQLDDSKSKRARACKRKADGPDAMSTLQQEAFSIITKLVEHKKSASFSGDGADANAPVVVDKRMADANFVFRYSLENYVRDSLTEGVPVSIDAVHSLRVESYATSAHARRELARQASQSAVQTAKFKGRCASLIVALWTACCSTPYMTKDSRKNGDSFRPFVCGVLYCFKRGLRLQDGSTLVPKCAELAESLPVLRATGGNLAAKALHSSSHRGVCTLNRSIASTDRKDFYRTFSTVSRIADSFAAESFSKFDI